MNSVKVNKTELLSKLKTNRENHRDLFLKAQQGFREAVIKKLDAMLAEARDGKRVNQYVGLPEPVDQTREYDNAIALLEMSVDDTIELTVEDFNCYVLDQWEWFQAATNTNSMYTR